MSRRYELKRRAEQQEATRRRIVEAAAELSRTVGPASATVSRIAEHAGVGRVTVYRHFPDPAALVQACGELHLERNPPPDPDRWAAVSDPHRRLRTALTETYAYYRANEKALAQGLFAARGGEVATAYDAHRRREVERLAEPWGAEDRQSTLRAAIGLALSFDTWRSLTRDDGLTDGEAMELMLRLAGEGLAPAESTAPPETRPSDEATPPSIAAAGPLAAPPPPPEPPSTSSRPLPSARRV